LLPALLVLAREAKRRRAQPRKRLPAHPVQPRPGLLEPLLEALQPRPAHAPHQVDERVPTSRFHGLPPGRRDVRRTRIATAEASRHLLHLPEPLAHLQIESVEHVTCAGCRTALRRTAPPVHRSLPGLRGCGAWRGAPQRPGPGIPVLTRHGLEITRPRRPVLPAVTHCLSSRIR